MSLSPLSTFLCVAWGCAVVEKKKNHTTGAIHHECIISLRFLGIILRGLRIEVSVYNVYITNNFQPTFAGGGGGGDKSINIGDCE